MLINFASLSLWFVTAVLQTGDRWSASICVIDRSCRLAIVKSIFVACREIGPSRLSAMSNLSTWQHFVGNRQWDPRRVCRGCRKRSSRVPTAFFCLRLPFFGCRSCSWELSFSCWLVIAAGRGLCEEAASVWKCSSRDLCCATLIVSEEMQINDENNLKKQKFNVCTFDGTLPKLHVWKLHIWNE